MSFNYLARSVDLKVNAFPEGNVPTDIAKSISDYFVDQNIKVLAIQQCPNKVARVIFEDRTDCELIRLRGELDMNGVKVPVVPPPPNWVNVVVYNYPYDVPDEYINDVLDHYSTVWGVRSQHWTNLPDISMATRLVHINLKKSIPQFVMFHTYRCKVWYRGQPLHCDICKEGSHIAFNCPYKGKCLSCKQLGHLARSCPSVCFRCKGSHASDSCPACRHWEYVSRDVEEVPSATDAAGATSDDLILADAASVAEVVVRAGLGQPASQSSQLTDVPEVIVVEEGVAAPPVALQGLDERFNQLDELDSQSSGGGFVLSSQIGNASQSILLNCGPGGASSGGELSALNQINQISQTIVENDASCRRIVSGHEYRFV